MSPRYSGTPLLLIAIWAGLLIAFMIVRPSPTSPLSWALIGSAMFVGVLYMQRSSQESRQTERATLEWQKQVYDLVDVHDYADDGHLPEYLDEAERRRVLAELRRMPSGARSLRRALAIVSPELLTDDQSTSLPTTDEDRE
jgi:hypothetical protein